MKPKKRQKSKVVQSLKLKFKREESTKSKDDQELINDTGKSIVHVTNEELNSSEMVFFCIPKVDSSIKNLPKKKLGTKDTKDNHMQKEIEIINQTNSETNCVNRLDSFVLEKNNTDNSVFTKNSNDESKEIKNEINFIPTIVAINNVSELDFKCEQSEVLNNQSLLIKSNFSENITSTNNMHKNSSDELNIYAIKTEFINDSDTLKSEKQSNFQNICTKLTNEDNFPATETSKIILDENITVKRESIENLPKCYTDVSKRDSNESEKQLINKWTIDEDKIILQTCKRVEDIEVLLETINRRIPQRSVSEVKFVYFYKR